MTKWFDLIHQCLIFEILTPEILRQTCCFLISIRTPGWARPANAQSRRSRFKSEGLEDLLSLHFTSHWLFVLEILHNNQWNINTRLASGEWKWQSNRFSKLCHLNRPRLETPWDMLPKMGSSLNFTVYVCFKTFFVYVFDERSIRWTYNKEIDEDEN